MSTGTVAGPETSHRYAGLVEIGAQPPLGEYLRTLWGRRDFVATVALGQLRAQNQNTLLGSLWHLLNPLLLAGVYYLLFGVLFEARGATGDGGPSYAAFLIVGLFVYTFINKGVMSGTRTVVSNMTLIRSIKFPRAALPAAAVAADTLGQVTAYVTMLLLVLVTEGRAGWAWLMLPVILLVQAVFNLGLSLVTGRLTFHFRDTEQLLPYLLRIWMYLSGVFFPLAFVQEHAGEPIVTLFKINPLYVFIRITRDAALENTVDPGYWLGAVLWASAALVVGFAYFYRHESEYGDE